jgi:hypothetical protein
MLMNSFTNTVLTLLLGWLRTLLNAARDFVSSDSSTAFFNFFRNNWKIIFLVLCVGGFVLDKIVYLIRWRPRPIWLRRRVRRAVRAAAPQEAYDLPEFDDDSPAIPADDYEPAEDYTYANAAPTVQYQLQSQQGYDPRQQAYTTQLAYPLYAAPQYAPEVAQPVYPEADAPLDRDDTQQWQPIAPADAAPPRYAFGMAPSFGSAQSEPAYGYHPDMMQSFAPPQYAQETRPADSYAPPVYDQAADPYAEDYAEATPPTYPEASPQFRPFSDRGEETFAPPGARRRDMVAKKARDLLNPDEAYESLSYQDLQQTVDVTKAFRSPVYPEKKTEGDA